MAYQRPKPWGKIKPPVGYGIDWSDPINTSVLARWLFNEGAGFIVRNLVGPQGQGVLTGGPVWTPGKFGQTILVNGSSQYLDVGTSTKFKNLATGDFTFSCWAGPSIGNVQQVVAGSRGTGGWMFTVRLVGNSAARLTLFGVADYDSGTDYNPIDGNLHLWSIVVRAASSLRFFIDGKFHSSAAVAGGTESTNSLLLMAANNEGTPFGYLSGPMSAADIWLRPLADSEILRLYTEPFAGIQTPRRRIISLAAAAGISGTAVSSITEADLVAGGKTIVITLSNDTWIAA